MWRALIVGLLFGMPTFVSAAPYFEFAPDYAQTLAVQPGQTVEQVFLPLNDRLAVIDLWVSTAGKPAVLDVTLVTASGTTVATRALSLAASADSSSGTRTSIILPAQIAVSGDQPYRLRVTPSGNPVMLYYSGARSVVPGTTSAGGSSYRYGAAVVNGEEQGYSFKFALTEAAETTKPVLSGLTVSQPAIGTAHIAFHAQEPVDVRVVYGTRTVPLTGEFTPCLPALDACTVSLPVAAGTAYAFTLYARDIWGNETTSQGSFTAVGTGPQDTVTGGPSTPSATATATPVPATPLPSALDDRTPPVISNPRLISLTPNAASFAWSTNEAASSWLVILILPELTAWSGTLDNTLELEHFVPVRNITADTYMRARITSADRFGNSSTVNIDFKTPATGELQPTPVPGTSVPPAPLFTILPSTTPGGSTTPTPPLPSDPPTTPAPATGTATPTPAPSVVAYPSTSTEPGVITWQPASGDIVGYRIDIFDADNNLITTLTAGKDATSLQLPAGVPTGARVIVYADRSGAFEKVGIASVSDRTPALSGPSYTASVAIIAGGIVILAALMGAWVWERRRQRTTAGTATSLGLGGGPGHSSPMGPS